MTNESKIIAPHLNAEIYRTDTRENDRISYLDYIRIHTDGSILIGCSELTGRQWTGGASVFKDVTVAKAECRKYKQGLFLPVGSADGCFLNDPSKVILCDDNGTVSIWSTPTNDAWNIWTKEMTVSEHDDAVLAIDCLDPGKEYVTASADGNVKVWSIEDMICIRNYQKAHNMAVYGVAVKPNSKTCFATASLDNFITMWDDNIAKPVIDIVKNDCGVRCLQWLDEDRVVFGDEAGVLALVDVRNAKSKQKLSDFPAAVHKLSVQVGSNKVAVCCDNKIVSVCCISKDGKSSIDYHDRHNHSNYVRSAAWDAQQRNLLHTVGWDGEIKTHTVK